MVRDNKKKKKENLNHLKHELKTSSTRGHMHALQYMRHLETCSLCFLKCNENNNKK